MNDVIYIKDYITLVKGNMFVLESLMICSA